MWEEGGGAYPLLGVVFRASLLGDGCRRAGDNGPPAHTSYRNEWRASCGRGSNKNECMATVNMPASRR
jgi:hypothetical protein